MIELSVRQALQPSIVAASWTSCGMRLKVVVNTQAATGRAIARWARIRPRSISSNPSAKR
jgi:hypothetical protein